ncbi:MAG: AMP-binding protein [Pseudomonadota bacterium]
MLDGLERNHLAAGLLTAPGERIFAEMPEGGTVSYAALADEAACLATVLQGAGLAPGERVAVQVEKSLPALTLYLATILAGGVFLPLNPAYTGAEVTTFLADAEPAIVVCDPARQAAFQAMAEVASARALFTLDAAGAGSLMQAATPVERFEVVARGPDDLAAILYTSGTTGRSKGAMLSHENLLSNARTLAEIWRFGAEDRLIHALPIFHTHGLFVATNVALIAGCSLIFLPKFDAEAVLAAMPQATALMGVPTFYTRLLEMPDLGAAARSMRLFIAGSAPLLAATHEAWRALTGHAILERYGMTETGMITSNPHDGERRPGSVGPALPDVEIRVTGADGLPLPAEEIGAVEVRGPNVFQGYWRMPEKTREEFREDGFFITGDLGRIGADGYLTLIGRAKDLVISGGFNVYPKEVEAALDALDGVVESAVIGLPHPDLGEAVAAVVVAEPEAGLSEDAVRGALAERLARFKQPRRIFFADALPRNAMGKVQKVALRADHAETFAAKADR